MNAPEPTPDRLEAMAFQLVLHKLMGVEQTMQGMLPLLQKIVNHLEAQNQRPEVEIATYGQLYPEVQEVPDGTTVPEAAEALMPALPPPRPRPRLWRWFLKEP
jgi:hypothetical protein